MKGRVVFVSVCLLLAALTVSLSETRDQLNLTVHEWGTFTSIAGVDGAAVQWQAYGGPVDLPCLVHTVGKVRVGLRGAGRMGLPVVYLYTAATRVAEVKMSCPRGPHTGRD